ncbi:hypothetical protein [Prosthecochloris vibrioformis]|uniref:Uncharacterized protein n=1 Tax=Prosthecochloris vibrioformis TaxID=1098 RepID=A0A5C4S1S4_PROVB|nr:hypothetical protein [Prosthecochloris vibrioformis]TNJ37410.1 hypothetical protein FGF68_04155 [Prosthecochloris vibrioformis]
MNKISNPAAATIVFGPIVMIWLLKDFNPVGVLGTLYHGFSYPLIYIVPLILFAIGSKVWHAIKNNRQ